MIKNLKDHLVLRRKRQEMFYEAAVLEFQSGEVRLGLMAKAMTKCQGDKERAKVIYLQLLTAAIEDDDYIVSRLKETGQFTQEQPEEAPLTPKPKNISPRKKKLSDAAERAVNRTLLNRKEKRGLPNRSALQEKREVADYSWILLLALILIAIAFGIYST